MRTFKGTVFKIDGNYVTLLMDMKYLKEHHAPVIQEVMEDYNNLYESNQNTEGRYPQLNKTPHRGQIIRVSEETLRNLTTPISGESGLIDIVSKNLNKDSGKDIKYDENNPDNLSDTDFDIDID